VRVTTSCNGRNGAARCVPSSGMLQCAPVPRRDRRCGRSNVAFRRRQRIRRATARAPLDSGQYADYVQAQDGRQAGRRAPSQFGKTGPVYNGLGVGATCCASRRLLARALVSTGCARGSGCQRLDQDEPRRLCAQHRQSLPASQ
jgi:hypothetical protein